MVIHETEGPYWDRVSLNNTNSDSNNLSGTYIALAWKTCGLSVNIMMMNRKMRRKSMQHLMMNWSRRNTQAVRRTISQLCMKYWNSNCYSLRYVLLNRNNDIVFLISNICVWYTGYELAGYDVINLWLEARVLVKSVISKLFVPHTPEDTTVIIFQNPFMLRGYKAINEQTCTQTIRSNMKHWNMRQQNIEIYILIFN